MRRRLRGGAGGFPVAGVAALAALAALVAGAWPSPGAGGPLRAVTAVEFPRETITMTVDSALVSIHGVYEFRNNLPRNVELPVTFPFAVDESADYPHAVAVFVRADGDSVPVPFEERRPAHEVAFHLTLPASRTLHWEVRYRQRVHGSRGRYVLTSARAWGKPLESGDYRFVLPRALRVVEAWPEPEREELAGERRVLSAHREAFLPDREMQISWAPANEEPPPGVSGR